MADAVDACRLVSQFLEGKERADLDRDLLVQSAVIRQIEVIGEACSRVGTCTRDRHPEIPWRDIVGMRHRLIHGYAAIDLDLVWKTAREEVPALEAMLVALLGRLGGTTCRE
ncbi:MAG: DUF86 domain-containing protein [Pseudomonadota bacterium]